MSTAAAPTRRILFRLAVAGAAGWALATLAIRLMPTVWFEAPLAALAGVAAALLAALVPLARFIGGSLPPHLRVPAMTALVLPGMVGDGVIAGLCRIVLPNLPAGSGGWFGGLMLLGYAVLLAASLAPRAGAAVAA